MVTIYLTRHGETIDNINSILQGILPGQLTEKGIEQAKLLRDELASTHLDAILCSDLKRAMDTATIVAEPHALTPIPYPILRERDWGSATGTSTKSWKGKELPADVESVEHLFERATQFLNTMLMQYEGQQILVVAHGLFNRVIQAVLHHATIRDITPMGNAEVRILRIEKNVSNLNSNDSFIPALVS